MARIEGKFCSKELWGAANGPFSSAKVPSAASKVRAEHLAGNVIIIGRRSIRRGVKRNGREYIEKVGAEREKGNIWEERNDQ